MDLQKTADPHRDPHEETSGRKQWKHGCERVFQFQRKRSKTSGKRYFQNFSTLCNQQVGGSNPSTSSILPQHSILNMGEFPSGQRGQTVNLLSMTSVVRIHLPPPNSALKDAEFCFILSTFRTILCIFIKAAPDRARQFSGANRCCFLFFSLFLTARRGQSQLACCLSLRDIDANPDANGDETKRAWLDKMR